MKIETNVSVEFRDSDVLNFCKESFENFPEASFCLSCIEWKYKKGIYKFLDEDGKTYIVSIKDVAEKGFPIFFKLLAEKKIGFCGFNLGDLMGIGTADGLNEALCNADAIVVDALLQCTIFGDVIYG